MTQRPGGAPFMDRLPQSVVDRFEGTQKTAKTAASETCFGSNHHKPISESQIVGSGQSHPAHCGFCGRDFDVKVRWDSDGYPFVAIPRHKTPVAKSD